MPEEDISRRGGAKRWRTIKLADGRTLRVAIVRKVGPKGGHTVPGRVRDAKKKGGK